MKKIKFEKKLSLSKETITKLNSQELTAFVGGGTNTCPSDYATCNYLCITMTNCQGLTADCTF
ncbi:MAG TPA: class I lanthipeptide [Bacteroidia bacterium]|jgi:natural product precursor|nr:class I lanthipeptide [Bacteroidia bacterium]